VPTIFAQRAIVFIRLHDWSAAEADVKKADQLDATNSSARSLLPLFERSRDWQPQVRKLDAEIAKKPDDVNLRLDRAEWLIGVGFHDAGLDDVKEALKFDPKSLRARIWNGVMAWERSSPVDAGDVMELRFDKFTKEFRMGLRTIDADSDAEARARFLVDHKQPLLALAEVRDSADSPAKAQALFNWTVSRGRDRSSECSESASRKCGCLAHSRQARTSKRKHPGSHRRGQSLKEDQALPGGRRITGDRNPAIGKEVISLNHALNLAYRRPRFDLRPGSGLCSCGSAQLIGIKDGTAPVGEDRQIGVSFPTAMVPVSEIDVESRSSPIRLSPATPLTFTWKSQTEGIAKLGKMAPGSQLEVHVVAD
jgi:hypothetical protein